MEKLGGIFRRKPNGATAAPDGVERAAPRETASQRNERRRKPPKAFSVLKLVPQVVAGGKLHPREHEVVVQVLKQQLRGDDAFCAMDDDSYVVLLNGTTDELGMTVAHRLADQLLSRSSSVQRRIWHAGVATRPRDAHTEAALSMLISEVARRTWKADAARWWSKS